MRPIFVYSFLEIIRTKKFFNLFLREIFKQQIFQSDTRNAPRARGENSRPSHYIVKTNYNISNYVERGKL